MARWDVDTFVPQYPVPGGSVVETAEGEVPRPRHPNTSYAWKRKEPIRACRPSRAVRAITAKHIHQFAQPFWGRISTQSLSCPVLSCLLSRIKFGACQCQLEKRDHTVPVPVPVPIPMRPVAR